GYASRRPNQLSGGQEQRVSLARALVSEPRILLLDEPFAALDENLRGEIRSLVRDIQRQLQLTSIFVTHDQDEAAFMAHRIAFLHGGAIRQIGTARELYELPSCLETARFFGWQVVRTEAGEVAAIPGDAAALVADVNGPALVESSVDLGTRVSTRVRLESGESLEV